MIRIDFLRDESFAARYREETENTREKRRAYDRIRNKTPERLARDRARSKTPVRKAAQKARHAAAMTDPTAAEKYRTYHREWAKTEKGVACRRRHQNTPEHRVYTAAAVRRRRMEKNPVQLANDAKHANSEKSKARTRAWQKTPKGREVLRRVVARRRARMAGAVGAGLTEQQWFLLKELYDNRCAYCDSKARLTEEHLIPITSSGAHDLKNIAPACKPCNSQKYTRSLEWMCEKRGLNLDAFVRRHTVAVATVRRRFP